MNWNNRIKNCMLRGLLETPVLKSHVKVYNNLKQVKRSCNFQRSTPYLNASEDIKTITQQFVDDNGKVWLRDAWSGMEITYEGTAIGVEPLFEGSTSHLYQNGDEDSKTTIEQFIDENDKVWKRDEYIKGGIDENPTAIKSCDKMYEQKSVENVNKVLEKTHNSVKVEPPSEEITPNLSQNADEDSKTAIQQLIDENGKFWQNDEYIEGCYPGSIKVELEDLSYQNEITECSPLEIDTRELLEMVEPTERDETGPHFSQNQLQNENSDTSKFVKSEHPSPENFSEIDREIRKCHSCDFGTYSINMLKRHVKTVHSNAEIHKCDSCEYVSNTKHKLTRHINLIHSKHLNTFKCESCEYVSPLKGNLKTHVNLVHLKLKPYKCHLCDLSFAFKGRLNVHVESVHLKLATRKCHLCDFGHYSIIMLKRHMKTVHWNGNIYKCDSCEYVCNVKHKLRRHIYSVHSKLSNTFKCESCDYVSTLKGNLKTHVHLVHSKLKPYKCHLCNFSFALKGRLKDHVDSVHLKLKPYRCHLCNFRFASKGRLKVHMASVHLKWETHKCHLCHLACASKDKLKQHIDSAHVEENMFKCQYCDYNCGAKGTLRDHVDTEHLKLKFHKCRFCDFSAALKSTLQHHVDLNHSKLKIHKRQFSDNNFRKGTVYLSLE